MNILYSISRITQDNRIPHSQLQPIAATAEPDRRAKTDTHEKEHQTMDHQQKDHAIPTDHTLQKDLQENPEATDQNLEQQANIH